MHKTETILSGIIAGIIAFWMAYYVKRLVFDPGVSWLVYSLSSTPAPPGVFTTSEILRVGLRLPTPDTWLSLILLGSLAGTSALSFSDTMVQWQRIRQRLQRLFWVSACGFLLLVIGLDILEWAVTRRLQVFFSLANLLTMIMWIGLGSWLVYPLEKLREIVIERWLE